MIAYEKSSTCNRNRSHDLNPQLKALWTSVGAVSSDTVLSCAGPRMRFEYCLHNPGYWLVAPLCHNEALFCDFWVVMPQFIDLLLKREYLLFSFWSLVCYSKDLCCYLTTYWAISEPSRRQQTPLFWSMASFAVSAASCIVQRSPQ